MAGFLNCVLRTLTAMRFVGKTYFWTFKSFAYSTGLSSCILPFI